MWRGKQSARDRKRFECVYCIKNGCADDEGRHCYLYGEEKALVITPDIDEDDRVLSTAAQEELTREEFIEKFVEFCKSRSENPFRVMLNFFGGKPGTSNICPISLFDPEFNELILLADRCETYHTLYAPGSISEQPNWIMQIFDAFRSTKAEFEKESFEAIKQKK